LYKEVYGRQAPELIGLYVDLSDARRTADYKSKWYRTHEPALSIAKEVYGKDSVDYGMLLVDLGYIEINNQAPNGERRIRRGYKILKELDTPHPDMYRAEFVMGKLELANRKYMDARPHLESSLLAMNEGRVGPDFELTVRAFLVETLGNLGESELVTEHLLAIGRKQADVGISNLKPLFMKAPKFPGDVIRPQTGTKITKNKKGTVVLEFDVDEKGFTKNIKVIILDGPKDYAEPAIEAVKEYRFAPRFINGKPVTVRNVTQTFNFLL
jgi:TonB family protein